MIIFLLHRTDATAGNEKVLKLFILLGVFFKPNTELMIQEKKKIPGPLLRDDYDYFSEEVKIAQNLKKKNVSGRL